jgi:hypothetical protein
MKRLIPVLVVKRFAVGFFGPCVVGDWPGSGGDPGGTGTGMADSAESPSNDAVSHPREIIVYNPFQP